MSVYDNIKAHNYAIPQELAPGGMYLPVNQTGNLVFISGQGSIDNGKKLVGRAGIDVTLEEAQYAAKVSMLNTLGALQSYLGDLNRVKKVVKILGFVSCADNFDKQPQVINGASQVLIDVFGEAGKHARSAIGSNNLPFGLTVEIESIFEIE